MKFVDCPLAPFDTSIIVRPALSKSVLSASGLRRYFSIWLAYGSMPCIPSAAIRLIAHSMSCCPLQRELVLPKRMSGLTGSRERCDTAPHTLDGPTTLAAAVRLPNVSAHDRKSRLLRRRSVIFLDMDTSKPRAMLAARYA